MDFQYDTDQEDFRQSVRDFLQDTAPLARVRQIAGNTGHDERLWQRLCRELELPGLHVPVEYGGVGATLVESSIAFEELGRALTPTPLATHMFAVNAILLAGDEEQRHRLLPRLLSGARIATFADTAPVNAERTADGLLLTGVCSPVLHGHLADEIVVPAVHDDSVVLAVVAADSIEVSVEELPSFDITRPVARVTLQAAAAEVLAGTPDARDRVQDVARVLLAAEMLGGAQACLDLSVDYARSRTQFDRPIGSFQAVKHMCADMLIEIDATRVAVMFAAMTADDPAELAVAAPLVKAQAADTFRLCVANAIQVHGGIAFTWEHDLHLYFRRAKTTEALFGSSSHNRALLADRIGI